MPTPTQPTPTGGDAWTLEVVRGAHAGRRYPLDGAAITLGNAPAGAAGPAFLSLADEEGASPRRMAGRHAALDRAASGWTLRDLGAPGGTFVNNRRVLPGAAPELADGDLLQLGAVQLRLGRAAGTPPATPASSAPPGPVGPEFLYRSAGGGGACRTWDDFLTLSAQRWGELRDDLVAGRLAAFVAAVGRPDLAPRLPRATPTTDQADEALDAWLALLPTRTAALPELEVHPLRITIAAPAGGVTVLRKVRVANVGFRLLRARARIEGATGAGFVLGPIAAGRELVVRDAVDVPFEVALPDPFVGPAAAELVVAGAGIERRVAIRVERKEAAGPIEAGPGRATAPAAVPGPIAAYLALPSGKRVAIAALVALAGRLAVGVAGGAIGEDAMTPSGPDAPRLGGVVLAFAAAGAGLGGWLAARRSGRADAGSGGVAGAGLGTLLAAAAVASCRAIEPALGAWAGSPLVACALWGIIGAALAAAIPAAPPAAEGGAR